MRDFEIYPSSTEPDNNSNKKLSDKGSENNQYQSDNTIIYDQIPVPIDMNVNYNIVKH